MSAMAHNTQKFDWKAELTRLSHSHLLLFSAYSTPLVVIFLMLWRHMLPGIFIDGTAWAEIGTDFLPTAYEQPVISGLLKPDSGYLALFARLVSLLPVALHAPMAIAPLLVQHLCTAWQLLCCLVFVHPYFRILVRRDHVRAFICLLLMLHPDAELKSVINSAYWGLLPWICLAWADAVHPASPRSARVTLGCFGVILALSKAQMVALLPYACARILLDRQRGQQQTPFVWLTLIAACAAQLGVALSHIRQVEGALWHSGPSAYSDILLDVWHMARVIVRAGAGDGACVALRQAPMSALVALLFAVIAIGLSANGLLRQGDKAIAHVPWLAILVAVPATVLVAKMPVVMVRFVTAPCGFVAYRGIFMPAAVCFLAFVVLLARATEHRALTSAVKRNAWLTLAWLAAYSQPFGGASWLPKRDAFDARPPFRSMCEERARWPGSGADRWLSLLALEPRASSVAASCVVPVNPFPFAWERGCTLLRPDGDQDPTHVEAIELSTTMQWELPSVVQQASLAAFSVAAHGDFTRLRARLLRKDGTVIASAYPLPSLTQRDESVAFFSLLGPANGATTLRLDLAGENTEPLHVDMQASRPAWQFYGSPFVEPR